MRAEFSASSHFPKIPSRHCHADKQAFHKGTFGWCFKSKLLHLFLISRKPSFPCALTQQKEKKRLHRHSFIRELIPFMIALLWKPNYLPEVSPSTSVTSRDYGFHVWILWRQIQSIIAIFLDIMHNVFLLDLKAFDIFEFSYSL